MKREHIEQIIGEVVLYLPLILLSIFLGIGWSTISAMVIYCACKWFYSGNRFHVDSSKLCMLMSYTIFLAVGVLVRGLESITLYFENQPMISCLIALLLTWIFAYLGELQKRS